MRAEMSIFALKAYLDMQIEGDILKLFFVLVPCVKAAPTNCSDTFFCYIDSYM